MLVCEQGIVAEDCAAAINRGTCHAGIRMSVASHGVLGVLGAIYLLLVFIGDVKRLNFPHGYYGLLVHPKAILRPTTKTKPAHDIKQKAAFAHDIWPTFKPLAPKLRTVDGGIPPCYQPRNVS